MSSRLRLRRVCLAILLGSFAFLHTGCIEFERQVVSYRIDAQQDALLIFQNYQGIYGAAHEDRLGDAEEQQFRSVLAGGRTFFFSNWIFELNIANLDQLSADLEGEPASSARERQILARVTSAVKVLRENLTIENGPLYLAAEGRLCGTQTVRIGKLSAVLKAVNDGIAASLERTLGAPDFDAAERRRIEAVLRDRPSFLGVNGNQITFHHPMTAEQYRRDLVLPGKGDRQLAKLKAAGIHVTHAEDGLRMSVGQPADEVTRLALSSFQNAYRRNVLRFTQEQRIPVEPEFDVERAATKFLRSK